VEKSDNSKEIFNIELELVFNNFPKNHMKIRLGDLKKNLGEGNFLNEYLE
jgi:hypothetical protein